MCNRYRIENNGSRNSIIFIFDATRNIVLTIVMLPLISIPYLLQMSHQPKLFSIKVH